MKLRLNRYHIAGLVLFLIGIGVLVWGLVRLYKIDHRANAAELTAEDIKSGVYVTGTVSTTREILKGYALDSDRADRPLIVYSSAGTDNAYRTVFLTNFLPGTGKLIMTEVDEYIYTDLYHFLLSENAVDLRNSDTYDFDGVIVKRRKHINALGEFFSSLGEKYQGYMAGSSPVATPNEENTFEYTLKLIDPHPRRLSWLYCAPFIFSGVMVFAIGGKPYKRVK